jgi:predicted transcriptional regulator
MGDNAQTPCATVMNRLGRVEVIFGTGEGKKPCHRALMAEREAMAERAEIFVHQLQEDLARCQNLPLSRRATSSLMRWNAAAI